MEVINETGLAMAVVAADPGAVDAVALILVKGTFRLVPDGTCEPLPEAEQRPCSADTIHMDELGRTPDWVTDFAPFKPHTDCFVLGAAHAPGGTPIPGFTAGFQLGPIVKTVQVWGPRRWLATGAFTPPEPVATVPLRWELSAGGLGNPANPYGRGEDPDEDGIVFLPQIEHPAHLVQRRAEPKPPANLAPVPAWFPERSAKSGTRDQRWALFRAPLPPKDADASFHNAAPFDQQAGNYPKGAEQIVLHNLHPTIPKLTTGLPGLRPCVTLVRTDDAAETVTLRLDTVILMPDNDQVVLLWRGRAAAADQALSDIAVVLGGVEPIDQPSQAEQQKADALARHAAAKPKNRADEVAAIEAEGLEEVRTLLAKTEMPPVLRHAVATAQTAEAMFAALSGHLVGELKRLGHWKG
jgi:hypothetical protein